MVRTPAEIRNFPPEHANRLWGAHSVLFNGCRVTVVGRKWAGRGTDDLPPSNSSSDMWTLPDWASYENLLEEWRLISLILNHSSQWS